MSVIKKYDAIVPNEESMPLQPTEQRGKARRRVLSAVKLLFGGFSKTVFDCLVVDQSPHGLRIQVGSTHMLPKELIVEFPNGIQRPARLIWASASEAGLEYEA